MFPGAPPNRQEPPPALGMFNSDYQESALCDEFESPRDIFPMSRIHLRIQVFDMHMWYSTTKIFARFVDAVMILESFQRYSHNIVVPRNDSRDCAKNIRNITIAAVL